MPDQIDEKIISDTLEYENNSSMITRSDGPLFHVTGTFPRNLLQAGAFEGMINASYCI